MRYKLRGYQAKAKQQILEDIADGFTRFKNSDGARVTAVQLTAPTGSGKTVIASAVIEEALFGSENFPGRSDWTFLWVSDDPSLNEQTSRKFLMASDRLTHGSLEIVTSKFDQEALDAGKVYFLNVQKLSSSGNLSKEPGDTRQYSFWTTLTNTIKNRPDKFVIMIDEAHVGMKTDRSRDTIVSRIIGGARTGRLPAPVIVGITATPRRFEKAMDSIGRRVIPTNVAVEEVQLSGLLKDGLVLSSPEHSGATFNESAMLRHAVATTRRYEEMWQEYSHGENEPQVLPALVIQLANSPSAEDLSAIVTTVLESWTGLKPVNIAHTFADHNALTAGAHTIAYSNPEDIQDDLDIRVVLCKQAITTGWDCPRAEVLVSYRKVDDQDAITQVVGRMIRTPLARRIERNELLNYVHCFLPRFNKTGVRQIADRLKLGDDSFRQEWVHPEGSDKTTTEEVTPLFPSTEQILSESVVAKRATTVNTGLQEERLRLQVAANQTLPLLDTAGDVSQAVDFSLNDHKEEPVVLTDAATDDSADPTTGMTVIAAEAVTLVRNPTIGEDVFDLVATLPSYVIPGFQYRSQVDRLRSLATIITGGGSAAILQGASRIANERLLAVLRETRWQLDASGKFAAEENKLAHFLIDNEVTTLFEGSAPIQIDAQEEVDIDSKGIEYLFAQAGRRIGRTMADSYLSERISEDQDPYTAMMSVAVVAHQSGAKERLERVANDTILEWFKEYQTDINKSAAGLRAQLDEVRSEATEPEPTVISLPLNKPFPVAEVVWPRHLLSSRTGDYPVKLNEWEIHVVDTELQDGNCLGWYRNPSNGSGALSIPYVMNGRHRGVTPDFVFFHQSDAGIVPSILDPHAQSLSDSVPKLRGMAKYAHEHGHMFQRIESIIKVGGVFLSLNLKDAVVQSAIAKHGDSRPESLYISLGGKY
ncbi:DEAD/DEAH box helicase [Arthrobacter pityocampae]|uniref:DEAD/DEAH box helicase n=1 Tax=Arthrobacter pityocampae TaxID=547334 RepID=UPI00373601F0